MLFSCHPIGQLRLGNPGYSSRPVTTDEMKGFTRAISLGQSYTRIQLIEAPKRATFDKSWKVCLMSPQVYFVILFKINITFERFSRTGEYFPQGGTVQFR